MTQLDRAITRDTLTKAAVNFCKSGWAMSGVVITCGPNAGVYDGIAAAGLPREGSA
jgi:hypothetical protein